LIQILLDPWIIMVINPHFLNYNLETLNNHLPHSYDFWFYLFIIYLIIFYKCSSYSTAYYISNIIIIKIHINSSLINMISLKYYLIQILLDPWIIMVINPHFLNYNLEKIKIIVYHIVMIFVFIYLLLFNYFL